MLEYIKKGSIILSHTICIFVLIYSFATTQQTVREEEQTIVSIAAQNPEETPTQVILPTATVTPTSEPTQTPVPMETPVPSVTEIPTETPIPEPVATVIPKETPELSPTPTVTETPVLTISPEETRAEVKNRVLQNIADNLYTTLDNKSYSWWFRRKTGHVPSGSGESFKIAEYQGFYLNTKATKEDKVVYLTLDCGYGSSNTGVILDVFKKHDIKVTFFVTGNFLKACPEYVKRMVEEGHAVANHSVSHADLTELTEEEIYREIVGCEDAFYKITGTQMAPYFRPPEGAYSKRTMQITQDLGYKTIFWSLAYNDYNKNNQPGAEYVLDHFTTYHHNGAVPLMHNDSDSNMEAMDEVISFLKEQGYRFGTLDELN